MTMKLLIAEDARDVAEVVAFGARMTWPDCRVTIAPDGQAALDHFAAEGADLVVLDVAMPPPDGFEVCRRLKADPATAPIPVIALTAQAMAGDREKTLEAGCDDYEQKPIEDLPRLIGKIEALAARSADDDAPGPA